MDSQLVRRGLGSEQARGYQLCGRKVITPRSRGAVPIPPPHARVHARRHARELHGTLTHSMARSHSPPNTTPAPARRHGSSLHPHSWRSYLPWFSHPTLRPRSLP